MKFKNMKQWLVQWMGKRNKKAAFGGAAAAVVLAVILALAPPGIFRFSEDAGDGSSTAPTSEFRLEPEESEVRDRENTGGVRDTEDTGNAGVMEDTEDLQGGAAPEGAAPDKTAISLPKLEKDQTDLLDRLMKALEERNYEEAGTILLDNEQKLQYLFYQTLGGERFLYRDGVIETNLEGEGLVLKKPLSVFYGMLRDGLPEGEGVSVQGIVLDGQRYDYSDGTWMSGKMNGTGTVGYRYYRGAEEEISQAVERTGTFENDLMNGKFLYRTTSGDGETTLWEMEALKGVTVLDDRWLYDEEKQTYSLPAGEDSSHTYVLSGDTKEEARWRNMLLWEE